ncbi:MAG: restriction endonuclease [Bacteroidia bacterium]|nr:restriction endonuclease [Methylotenera sp.]
MASFSKSAAPFALLFLIPGLLVYVKQNLNRAPKDLTLIKRKSAEPYVNTTPNYSQNKLKDIPSFNQVKIPEPINEWSLSLLKEIEWKRFEMLCAEYFRCLGKRVETINNGADGGIDARIFSDKTDLLEYAIQCKSWSNLVSIKPLRELYGVMSHEAAAKGIFMTTSDFTNEAKQFAADHNNKLFLINGEKFVSMILKLPKLTQKKLLAYATEGDYKTPSCPSCGIKLLRRASKDRSFWGCSNFPKCRTTMHI